APGVAEAGFKLSALMQGAGLVDRFVTLSAALLDPAAHQAAFVNAGHLPPLLVRGATGRVEEALPRDVSGFPLGVAEGAPYRASPVLLREGDSVLVFSDGLTEAKNKSDLEFQLDGVRAALQAGPLTPRAM